MGTLLIFLGVFGVLAYEKYKRYQVKKYIQRQDAIRRWMLEDSKAEMRDPMDSKANNDQIRDWNIMSHENRVLNYRSRCWTCCWSEGPSRGKNMTRVFII